MRSFLLPPEKVEFETSGINCASLTVSPNGRSVTFAVKGADGRVSLWLRSIGDLAAHAIPGTEGAVFPFWSPDSRFLAFFAGGKLMKADLAGAPPLSVCDAPNGRSGSWNRDGVIIFSPDTTTEIYRVPAAGGAATPVTKLDAARSETTHRWATFLPDGKRFLYMAGSHATGAKSESNAIYLGSLGSSERTLLLQARSNVSYASGYLLYMRERMLLAQPFDAGRGRLAGDPVPVADGVQYDPGYFRGDFAVSDNGLLVYASGVSATTTRLRWLDGAGKPVGEPFGDLAEYAGLTVSPDGTRIVATINDPSTGQPDLWMMDSPGRPHAIHHRRRHSRPVWSPDGSRIAFANLEKPAPRTGIYVKPSSGGGQQEAVYHSDATVVPNDWSSDGRFLLLTYFQVGSKTKQDIWILPLSGERKAAPLVATPFNERDASFSPDGRWITYISDESGADELYAAAFPGPGGKWQVSSGGAVGGTFFADGKAILYGTADNSVFRADVKAGASGLEIGVPTLAVQASAVRNHRGHAGLRTPPSRCPYGRRRGSPGRARDQLDRGAGIEVRPGPR